MTDSFFKWLTHDSTATTKGGRGSGNFGHAGRPGHQGGSVTDSITLAGMIDKTHQTPAPETLGKPSLYQDNPELWENNPIKNYGADHPGSITASFNNLWLDPRFLATIPGQRGEEKRIEPERVKTLAESMEKQGFLQGYNPLVCVESDGHATVWEGNHRIRAAVKAGLKAIPVDIRYFGSGELRQGRYTPDEIMKIAYNK